LRMGLFIHTGVGTYFWIFSTIPGYSAYKVICHSTTVISHGWLVEALYLGPLYILYRKGTHLFLLGLDKGI
jgi:hypothetical protein